MKLPRNWFAVHAHNRKGGHHGDKAKETKKSACRSSTKDFLEEWYDELEEEKEEETEVSSSHLIFSKMKIFIPILLKIQFPILLPAFFHNHEEKIFLT